jgi:GNAT superfamily N-acetyltransferase
LGAGLGAITQGQDRHDDPTPAGTAIPAGLVIQPVTPERWDELVALFETSPVMSSCWCMNPRLRASEFSRFGAEARRRNREVMRGLVEGGTVPGLLGYVEGRPAGRISVGPREQFVRLRHWSRRSPEGSGLGTSSPVPLWSIVCFYTRREYRRRGMTRALIQAALEYAAEHGAGAVEAYLLAGWGEQVGASDACGGLASTFRELGFVEVGAAGKKRGGKAGDAPRGGGIKKGLGFLGRKPSFGSEGAMRDEEQVEWLFRNGGPILRYRVAVELMDLSVQERARLLGESLATPEVQRWLKNLGQATAVHGSTDGHAENALAKLLDYGHHRGIPEFAMSAERLLALPLQAWDPLVLLPFLLRAGYTHHPRVRAWLAARVETLVETAQRGSFDFYLDPEEASSVPKAWRGKPIYRDEFGHAGGYALPTCYDFYALAYCPLGAGIHDFASKAETIVAFLSDPRFQSTVGGYGWDKARRRCYAAGRVFLACVMPARLVLFLELGARFTSARRSAWFQEGLSLLETYRTPRGTYCFPSSLLAEKAGYQMYAGAHMGLGENRRLPLALELESTFHRLYIQKRASD